MSGEGGKKFFRVGGGGGGGQRGVDVGRRPRYVGGAWRARVIEVLIHDSFLKMSGFVRCEQGRPSRDDEGAAPVIVHAAGGMHEKCPGNTSKDGRRRPGEQARSVASARPGILAEKAVTSGYRSAPVSGGGRRDRAAVPLDCSLRQDDRVCRASACKTPSREWMRCWPATGRRGGRCNGARTRPRNRHRLVAVRRADWEWEQDPESGNPARR